MLPGAFREVACDLLRHGYAIRFRADGTSMLPTIADGETLVAEPLQAADARVGDVVLCDVGPRLVAHRLVRKRPVTTHGKRTFVFHVRGDAPGAGVDRIEAARVLGRVRAIERPARHARLLDVMLRAKQLVVRSVVAALVGSAVLFASLDAHASASDIQVGNSASSTLASGTTQTFTIDPGSGADRVLLIGISYSSANEAVNDVTFAGVPCFELGNSLSGIAASVDVWEVDNPPSGSGSVVINYRTTVAAVAGATAFANAQAGPAVFTHNGGALGQNSDTASFIANDRDVVFDVMAVSSATTATAASQTTEWNLASGAIRGAGSVQAANTTPGTTWTFQSRQRFADMTLDVVPANTPTAILARSVVATDDESGTLVRWRASTLGNTLGYRIYREEPGQTGMELVNPELIAGPALSGAEGGSVMGARDYAWHDRTAHSRQARYTVEEVDLSGPRRRSRPVSPTGVTATSSTFAGSTVDSPTLSQQARSVPSLRSTHVPLGAQASVPSASASATPGVFEHPFFRPTRAVDPDPNEGCEHLASRPAVKIRVEHEGVYDVPWADLVGAGLDPATDPRSLRLYADGVLQTLRVVPGAGDAAAIEFYGVGSDTPWSAGRTYWLTTDASSGERSVPARALRAVVTPTPAGSSGFAFTTERQDRTVYGAALKTADGNNFFGATVTHAGSSQSLTVTHLDPSAGSPATLTVAVQGASASAHDVTALLDGEILGAIAFHGQSLGVATFTVPSGQLVEGANELTLRASPDDSDVSLFAWARLTYRHTFVADDDQLFFPSPSAASVRIGGFTTDDVRVLDVTDPDDVGELSSRVVPDAGGYAVVATLPPWARRGARELYAFAGRRVRRPVSVRANHPSAWHRAGARAELVIVTSGALLASVEPLATLRQSQGWSVATVDEEDVFDEYNCGEKNPGALKSFLGQSHQSSPAARYVLLVGDASFDPRDYLGLGDHDHVPTKLLATSTIQTASDDWFGDFDGDGVPDVGVGRIPAATAAQVDTVVRKLATYPSTFGGAPATGGTWTNVGLVVSDDNDGYDFESQARRVEAALPAGMEPQEFFRSAQDPVTAEHDLVARLGAGAALVNYVGHGSVQLWDGMLQTADVPGLANGSRLPVFVDMTCLNALFHDPRLESLGAKLLLADGGGAIAVWGSSTSPDATVEDAANEVFVRRLPQRALGDAVIQTKAAITDTDFRIGEVLLGDPSLFGVPARPSRPARRTGPSTPGRIEVDSNTLGPQGPDGGATASSSCSIDGRRAGKIGSSLFFLAIAGALVHRRRSRARP